jgi:hypothetical protein
MQFVFEPKVFQYLETCFRRILRLEFEISFLSVFWGTKTNLLIIFLNFCNFTSKSKIVILALNDIMVLQLIAEILVDL